MDVTRRSLLAASAGIALAAVPAVALARTSASGGRTIRLRPGGSKTLTFPLGPAAGFRLAASVRSSADSALPFVRAHISSGPASQLAALAGSPAAGGQSYSGSGAAHGNVTVRLVSEDYEHDLAVRLAVSPASSAFAGWRQASARQNGCWLTAGHSDFGKGLLLAGQATLDPGDQALLYVPLHTGQFKVSVTGRAEVQAELVNLDPAVTGSLWSDSAVSGKTATATLALPAAPTGLSVTNSGSHRAAYRVRVSR